MINIAGIEYSSIVDGPGIRVAIFLQGCDHHCPDCHNPETHEFGIGKNYTYKELFELVKENSISKNITLTGGDPVYQFEELFPFVKLLKDNNYNILLYTGFTADYINNLIKSNTLFAWFISCMDTIITEPFIKKLESRITRFRGSTNQKVYIYKNNGLEDITDSWDFDL